jgi:hypothetical protein
VVLAALWRNASSLLVVPVTVASWKNVMGIFMTSAGKYNISGNLTPAFVTVVCKWSVLCSQALLLFTPWSMVPFWTVYSTSDRRRPAMMLIQGTDRKQGDRSCDCWVWHNSERKGVNCKIHTYSSGLHASLFLYEHLLYLLYFAVLLSGSLLRSACVFWTRNCSLTKEVWVTQTRLNSEMCPWGNWLHYSLV